MPVGGAAPGAGGSPRRGPSLAPPLGPSPPAHRPTWLLVLSSLTLVYGGLLLVSGLTVLRDPAAAAHFQVTRSLPPEQEAMMRELVTVNTGVVARHSRGLRVQAAASTALALLMLYAAAAALSRDRRGRSVTLLAAWLGIAYQVGSLPIVIPIARECATATSAVLLARLDSAQTPQHGAAPADKTPPSPAANTPPASADKANAAPADKANAAPADKANAQPPAAVSAEAAAAAKPEAVVAFTHKLFVATPIATALLGILGSLLLVAYFGGRRGRALYGLEPSNPRR